MTTRTTLIFPSVDWFEALAGAMAANEESFRKLGTMDATVGVEIMADEALPERCAFLLRFAVYSCEGVEEFSGSLDNAADFVLSAPYGIWRSMVQNIRENGAADLRHTLNYLHFGPLSLRSVNQLQADLFFRVNGSLQAFFDGAATLDTEFRR